MPAYLIRQPGALWNNSRNTGTNRFGKNARSSRDISFGLIRKKDQIGGKQTFVVSFFRNGGTEERYIRQRGKIITRRSNAWLAAWNVEVALHHHMQTTFSEFRYQGTGNFGK